MIRNFLRLLLFTCSFCLASNGSVANTKIKSVKTYYNWDVYVDNNPTICWAAAKPVSSKVIINGKAATVKRGEIVLYVTFIPNRKDKIQVTFTPGFAPTGAEMITNGGKDKLLIDGSEWAWAMYEQDVNIAKKIAAYSKLTIRSLSSRGTITEDTFSLKGSKAAIKDAGRRCKIQTAFLDSKNTNTASNQTKKQLLRSLRNHNQVVEIM